MTDSLGNKKLNEKIPSSFTYKTKQVVFIFMDDESEAFSTSIASFQFSVKPLTDDFLLRVLAAKSFLENINGAFALSTESKYTRNFITGVYKNISIEVPANKFNLYELSTFLYYKVKAILSNTAIISEFKVHQLSPVEVDINVDINMLNESNPFLEEKLWIEDLNTYLDENGNTAMIEENHEDYVDVPWWHRPDGQVRDFYHGISDDDDTVYNFQVNLDNFLDADLDVKNNDDNNDDNNNDDSNGPTIVSL